MFLFFYYRLWCLVYCWRRFCQFALVDSTIWFPWLLDLFLLLLIIIIIILYLLYAGYLQLYTWMKPRF
jgi:hypothetical protein